MEASGIYLSLASILGVISLVILVVSNIIRTRSKQIAFDTRLETVVEFMEQRIMEQKETFKDRLEEYKTMVDHSTNTFKADLNEVKLDVKAMRGDIGRLEGNINIFLSNTRNKHTD